MFRISHRIIWVPNFDPYPIVDLVISHLSTMGDNGEMYSTNYIIVVVHDVLIQVQKRVSGTDGLRKRRSWEK